MTAPRPSPVARDGSAHGHRRGFSWRNAAAPMMVAVLCLPVAAQNWVGFGDNAWPTGNTLSSRGTIAPNGAGELFVRLDAWEHGGWGTDPLFPGTHTIDAVKFYAHTSVPSQTITIKFWNQGPPHIPGVGGVAGTKGITVSGAPVLHTLSFPPLRMPCVGAGDMFISFVLTANDGVKIGQVSTATDVPGGAYTVPPLAYGAPVPSHCISIPTFPAGPLAFLPGPAQFYIDVGHAAHLASGVGGTITNQGVTFPNSGVAPGTSGFLSGSFPDCTGIAGGRVPPTPDSITMKIRAPTVCAPGAGSIVLFVVAAAPILPCILQPHLGLFFPSACSSGVVCIDPTTIVLETVVPLSAQGDAMVQYGPLMPFWVGGGVTHQAFILDPASNSVLAGPCDRQEL